MTASPPLAPGLRGDAFDVVIVGGGLAGLATAHVLRREAPALRVVVLEADASPGGKVRSESFEGFAFDWGPNGFLTNVPQTVELARELGLAGELVEAAEAARHRFLFRDGALRRLPASPPAFLRSELLGARAKARAALEPFVRRWRGAGEESVHAFVARRFGAGVAEAFAGPFTLGIAAGDARLLSVDALFPRLRELERRHGSVVRGMIAARKQGGGAGRLTSLVGGAGRLTEALAERLGETVRTGRRVRALRRQGDGFVVETQGEAVSARQVVLALPAHAAASLVTPFAPDAARELESIRYADVDVFGLVYDRIDVPHALDGFGFLAPRTEGVRSLGVLFSTSIFPPPGGDGRRVLLRVLAGGAVDPEFTQLDEDDRLEIVRADLRRSLRIVRPPLAVRHVPWQRGIPQYEVGHAARVARLETILSNAGNVHLTGNAYRGVGVNDVVRDAARAALRVMERARTPGEPR